MDTYHVRFVRNGETEPQVVRYLVGGMGNAFAKCVRRFPEAKLIEGWIEGSYADGCGITVYAPPSTIRIVAEPAPKEEQTVFDFLREISLSPRNGRAMRCRRSCNLIRRTSRQKQSEKKRCSENAPEGATEITDTFPAAA